MIGYDDSALMTCIDPPLTTVRQPIEAMAKAAVDLLVSEIAGARVDHDEVSFEPDLVVRGSSGPVPVLVPAAVPASGGGAAGTG